jgi:Rrf2 family transcriptional regulator, cysteine metabolism repressor
MKMKISRASMYALHAVAHIASYRDNNYLPSYEIAQAQNIPDRFLLKILKSLVTTNILMSVKGPNGGYRLADSPENITVLSIVESVDGQIQANVPEIIEGVMFNSLVNVCEECTEDLRTRLASLTISDLLEEERQVC